MNNNGNNNQHSNGGFINGLLLGVIIGGGAVFLLGTKKGKKLLKTLTEEGLEGISELEDLLEEESGEYKEPLPVKEDKTYSETELNGNGKKESAINKITTTGKRFFKGIKRKSS